MNPITKYERRHSIHNDDISLGRFGADDSSIDTNSIYSSSSRIDDAMSGASKSLPQHLRHRWRIDESQVQELPEIYPRLSSPLIVRNREISQIGDRLWSFLRTNEIRSAYDREEGRVLCCTSRVSFVVQFWRRRIQEANRNAIDVTASYFPPIHDEHDESNDTLSDQEEIILEIQRRKGCSWTMHKIRSAMKKWILRKQNQQRQHHKSHFPPPMMRSNSERFGMIGLEPLVLGSKITSIQPKNDITNTTAIPSRNEEISSKSKSSALATISMANKPLFSCSMPPLKPTFGVCPQPHWLRTEAPSTRQPF